MTSGFDEQEWRESAKDGPSFEFEPAPDGQARPGSFAPEPEPVPPGPRRATGPDTAEAAHRAAWQAAEPPPAPPSGARRGRAHEARRPGAPSSEERNLAMVCHGAGAVSVLVTGGVVGWLVPLVVWLMKKDEGGFASDQALEALNFQLTMFILILLGGVLICIDVGWIILGLVWLAQVVYSIIGAVRTYHGESYEYPVNFRLIGGASA